MNGPLINWGNLFYLPIALLPLITSRGAAFPTLVSVLAGASLGYHGERMPRAKRLMIPGFAVGLIGTLLAIHIGPDLLGYEVTMSNWQALWWSGWFAFFAAPLLQSVVLTWRMRNRPSADPSRNDGK